MLVLTVGLPGLFTDWGESVIAALITRAYGAPKVIVADKLDDIAETVIVSDVEDLVVAVRQPDARLRRAMLASVKPMVVFLDDPRQAALNLIANHAYSVVLAVRVVSAGCVKLMDFGKSESALVLMRGPDETDRPASIRKLAAHIGVQLSESDMLELIEQFSQDEAGEPDIEPNSGRMQAALSTLPERDRAILDETLGTYADALAGQMPTRLIWPRDLFGVADSPNEPAMRDIDIAGRARCLVFGPYMPVFAGNWKARMILGFSAETVGVPFTVDVGTPERIAHTAIIPDAAGVFEVSLDFTIEEPDGPVEIRVFMDRAAFDGHIALGFVALTPGQTPVAQASSVEDYLAGRLSA